MATAEQIEQVRLNIDDLNPTVNNLIDRGDCESETPPAIRPEISNDIQNATFQRSAEKSFRGTYSYKYEKTDVSSYVALTDNQLSNDLHGLTPSQKYTFASRLWIPSGGIQASDIILRWRHFDGGSLFYDIKAAEIYDAWQYLFSIFELPDIATGVAMRYQAQGSTLGEFWIDEIEVYEGNPVITNLYENDFTDNQIELYIDIKDSVNYASWKLIDILIVRLRKEILKEDQSGSETTEFYDLDKRLSLLESISKKYEDAYNSEIGNNTGQYIRTRRPVIAGGLN